MVSHRYELVEELATDIANGGKQGEPPSTLFRFCGSGQDIAEAFLNEIMALRDDHQRMVSFFLSMGSEYADKQANIGELSSNSYAWFVSAVLSASRNGGSLREALIKTNDSFDDRVQEVIATGHYLPYDVESHYKFLRHRSRETLRRMERA